MKKIFTVVLALIVILGLIAPVEASSRHHRNSIGRQIQRVAERNLVRLVDRSLRAYTDNYINDVYYWHRQRRNQRLRNYRESITRNTPNYRYEIVVSNGNSQYAIGGVVRNRPMDQNEIAVMKMIATAVETGRPIQARSNYHRQLIIRTAQELGFTITRGKNFLVYVTSA